MKFNLLMLITLLCTVFVISETIPRNSLQYAHGGIIENNHELKKISLDLSLDSDDDYDTPDTNVNKPSSSEEYIEEKTTTTGDQPSEETIATENSHNVETTTDLDSNNVSITTEHPDNNNETTTEHPDNNETTTAHSIDTTVKDNVRNCPENQSSFSKHDIVAIINYISINEMNIMKVISDGYHDTAIQTRDKVLTDFNEFRTKFEDRPEHLNHVLEYMADTRQKKIVPLVKTAAAILQEFPVVEDDFIMLYNKTVKMLDNLENSKKICQLNNCRVQSLRSSSHYAFPLVVKTSTPESNDYFCSTVKQVHTTVKERLSTYEREEIEKIQQLITEHQELLEKTITELKINLKEAAVSQFGITMFEILNLYDDHFHFMNSLIDFNNQSYTSVIKKININIEYKLLGLDAKIKNYRQYCLTCNQGLRKHRNAADNTNAEVIETVSNSNVTNILDQLINDKITEIGTLLRADIEHIFKDINETVNDKEIVEKTVAKFKPIQESVSKQIELEKGALEQLLKSVPKGLRENAKSVLDRANSLMNTINDTLKFFRI